MREMEEDLIKQLDAIKTEAESVEIPEGIKPENMMKRIQEKKSQGYFEERKNLINKTVKKKKSGRSKMFAWITGGVATAAIAASLGIIIATSDISDRIINQQENKTITDYYNQIKDTDSKHEVATLNGYAELKNYIVANNSLDKIYTNDMEIYDDMATEESFDSDENATNNYSETNIRTENVYEADIVKTDGEYIYYLVNDSGYDGHYVENWFFSIVKASGKESRTLCNILLSDEIKNSVENIERMEGVAQYGSSCELILYENKAVILCEYLYDYTNYTIALIYDITDKQSPKLTDKLYVEGEYDSCRLVDGYLYIYTKSYINEWYNINGETDIDTEEEAMRLLAPDSSQGVIPADDVYVSGSEGYNMYHIIATVDMKDTTEFKQVKAILGESGAGNLYVSSENIYYTARIYEELPEELDGLKSGERQVAIISDKSEIMKIGYKNGTVEPKAYAVIEGYVGDEFDIDEYNGYLRVAVSISQYSKEYVMQEVTYFNGNEWVTENMLMDGNYGWDTQEGSALYVLDENLNMVGSIPKLKEDEFVYGVRFDGDIAYVVTYEQTDPLFAIDLSDPANPTVLSALKIPGFSTYLHKWDENTLIGIGYDEDNYVKISTFDITDKTDVKETDICTLDGVYYTEALYNHKAVFVCPEKNLIGFEDWYGQYRIFSYVDGVLTEVLNATARFLGTRCMYIGEYIYITSYGGIDVYDINTMDYLGYVEAIK